MKKIEAWNDPIYITYLELLPYRGEESETRRVLFLK